MSVLPDFGYGEDNYILPHHESSNKWRMLTGLIGDQDRFTWLMKYMKMGKLQKEIKAQEEANERAMIERRNARKLK